MPRRTQIYFRSPWSGGLNSSIDPGAIPDTDLVTADNIVFTTSGARIKREGHSYFDVALPTPISRSSSGITRKLIFAAAVKGGSPVNDKIVAGERLTITSTVTSGNEFTYYLGTIVVSAVSTTTVADDTIEYTGTGGNLAEGTTATTTVTVTRARAIVGLHDYWRFVVSTQAKSQRLVSVTGQHAAALPALPKLFFYDSEGRRNEIATAEATSNWPTQITKSCVAVMNETLIVGFDGKDNKPIKYKPESSANFALLGGTPPDFSICQVHQGRLWTNDKTQPDRLHYSPVGDIEQWQGNGDSGALDILSGDGDSQAITAIFPSFRGSIFVAKGNKLYEIVGDSPENYVAVPLTSGLGVVGQGSVAAVDVDDVVFTSPKGFHSLVATDTKGDFSGNYLSAKIQPTFNSFQTNRLSFTSAAYIPSLNSVAFAISEEGESANNAIYLYNVNQKEWYRWPDLNPQVLCTFEESSGKKLYYGTSDGRVVKTQNGTFTDFTSSSYTYKIKTGQIYPDGNPISTKAFKRIGLQFKPQGSYSFTVRVKIDNYASQSFNFAQTLSGALLGSTFTTGVSTLGGTLVMAPFMLPLDGIGRGVSVEIEHTTSGQQVEIYGLLLEFESADFEQDTRVET